MTNAVPAIFVWFSVYVFKRMFYTFPYLCVNGNNKELVGARGGVVVKALRYKPAGRGFDSRWCHWNFQ
jgi:hypothetical protein